MNRSVINSSTTALIGISTTVLTGISIMALIGILGSACSKTKIDSVLQPGGAEVATNSSVRLFNFYNFDLDITINNIPLTSYNRGTGNGTAQGLSLFPSGAWLALDNGNPFFVSNALVAKDRKVHVQISTVQGAGLVLGTTITSFAAIDTVLLDDPLHPHDYYALSTGHLLAVPRNPEAPLQPDHFKIRVINLGAATDPNNLTGPVRLTYSDGSIIDPLLGNVPAFKPADTAGGATPYISSYVELPYGAYMFKLFSNGDFSRQLAELPLLPNMDICDYPAYFPVPQEALFPRVRTFKPGASYTVVVTQNIKIFPGCNSSSNPVAIPFNGYRIITEQNPGPNTTYARMDAVNALPLKPLSIQVDGRSLGGLLPYTGHTDYGIYVKGTHQVQGIDASGNILVSKSITLSPYDNYTAWVYENPSGQPDICFANTDMTSTLYQTTAGGAPADQQPGSGNGPPIDDGTNGSIRVASIPYAWQTRFLNLSADMPFATFTNDAVTFPATYYTAAIGGGLGDSISFIAASVNLARGATPDYDPFVIFPYQVSFSTTGTPSYGFVQTQAGPYPPSVIRVFHSDPGPPALVPGTLLSNVAPVEGTGYIANPGVYTIPSYMPISEPGMYTTALVGRVNTASSAQDRGQLIILKHNK